MPFNASMFALKDNGASGIAPGQSGVSVPPPGAGGQVTAAWHRDPAIRPVRTGLPQASGALGPTSRDALTAACGSVPGSEASRVVVADLAKGDGGQDYPGAKDEEAGDEGEPYADGPDAKDGAIPVPG